MGYLEYQQSLEESTNTSSSESTDKRVSEKETSSSSSRSRSDRKSKSPSSDKKDKEPESPKSPKRRKDRKSKSLSSDRKDKEPGSPKSPSKGRRDRKSRSSSRGSSKGRKSLSPPRSTKYRRERDGRRESKERRRKDSKSPSPSSRSKKRDRHGRKGRRKVRFHDEINTRTIEYVDVPGENIWFTPEERDEFHERELALQEFISSNDEKYQSMRDDLNSEYVLTNEQEMRIFRHVDESLAAVLDEQERQLRVFYDGDKKGRFSLDWRKVSKEYYPVSKKALKEAQRRAAKHEKHLEALDFELMGLQSPASLTRTSKKGILKRLSLEFQKALIKSSKEEIPGLPVLLSARSA